VKSRPIPLQSKTPELIVLNRFFRVPAWPLNLGTLPFEEIFGGSPNEHPISAEYFRSYFFESEKQMKKTRSKIMGSFLGGKAP